MKIKKSKQNEPCGLCGEPSLMTVTLDDGVDIALCLSCDTDLRNEPYDDEFNAAVDVFLSGNESFENCLKIVKLKYSEVENG
jgi:hypothetical protein